MLAENLSQYKVCRPTDIVMNGMQAWSGMFAVPPHEGIVSPDYSVFKPTTNCEIGFFEDLFTTPILQERQEKLEASAAEARAMLSERRDVLDDVETIAAYAKDMKDFLKESELTERRAFIQSFIKEIVVVPGDALLRYTVPMPDDSSIPGRAAENVALNGSVLSTLPDGGRTGTVLSLSQKADVAWNRTLWIPAFAGMTGFRPDYTLFEG